MASYHPQLQTTWDEMGNRGTMRRAVVSGRAWRHYAALRARREAASRQREARRARAVRGARGFAWAVRVGKARLPRRRRLRFVVPTPRRRYGRLIRPYMKRRRWIAPPAPPISLAPAPIARPTVMPRRAIQVPRPARPVVPPPVSLAPPGPIALPVMPPVPVRLPAGRPRRTAGVFAHLVRQIQAERDLVGDHDDDLYMSVRQVDRPAWDHKRVHPRLGAARGYLIPVYSPGLVGAWDDYGELGGFFSKLRRVIKKPFKVVRKHWKKIAIAGAIGAGIYFGGPMLAAKFAGKGLIKTAGKKIGFVALKRVGKRLIRRKTRVAIAQAAGAALSVKAAGALPGSIEYTQGQYATGMLPYPTGEPAGYGTPVMSAPPGGTRYGAAAAEVQASTRPMMAGFASSMMPMMIAGAAIFMLMPRGRGGRR